MSSTRRWPTSRAINCAVPDAANEILARFGSARFGGRAMSAELTVTVKQPTASF